MLFPVEQVRTGDSSTTILTEIRRWMGDVAAYAETEVEPPTLARDCCYAFDPLFAGGMLHASRITRHCFTLPASRSRYNVEGIVSISLLGRALR
jgi:hypothetical protein